MQTILAAFALGLLFFQSPGQEKKTDRAYDDLNGSVRIVRIEREDLRDPSGNPKDNSRNLEKIVAYDVSGRVTEEIRSFRSGCVSSRHVFSYDAEGTRKEALYWGKAVGAGSNSDPSQPPLMFKQVFKLDEAGRRVQVDEYDYSGKLLGNTFYKYDDKGRVKEIVEGNNFSRCEFKYNLKGLASEKICQSSGSGARNQSEYAYDYDANGTWIKKTEKDSSMLPNGSMYESKRIYYREIKYYSSQEDQAQPTEVTDRFDATKLAPCPPLIIRKSGGVLQGSAIKRRMPSYPLDARAAGIIGAVVVEVTVNETGKVISTRTISGPHELREASERAAKDWEFHPTTLSKVPVKVIGTITFIYNL